MWTWAALQGFSVVATPTSQNAFQQDRVQPGAPVGAADASEVVTLFTGSFVVHFCMNGFTVLSCGALTACVHPALPVVVSCTLTDLRGSSWTGEAGNAGAALEWRGAGGCELSGGPSVIQWSLCDVGPLRSRSDLEHSVESSLCLFASAQSGLMD